MRASRNFTQTLRHSLEEVVMAWRIQRKISLEAQRAQGDMGDLREATREIMPSSVTIVVPCYNHSAHLSTMVNSIGAQTFPPGAVLFIDDASGDDTERVLHSLVKSTRLDSRCAVSILRNEKNLGQAATLNVGIEQTQTAVVMILNDDDCLLHDTIEVETTLLQRHNKLVMLGGLGIDFDDDTSLLEQQKSILKEHSFSDIEVDLFTPSDAAQFRAPNDLNMIHSGSMFLRSAWMAVGGYRADKRSRIVPFSDRDFQMRVSLRFPVGIARVPVSFWRSTSSVDAGINS